LPDANGQEVCLKVCNETSNCADGEICLKLPGANDGFCGAETCNGLFTDDCGPGANCIFFDNKGTCLAVGKVPEGDACETNQDCQAQHLCVNEICTLPDCSTDGLKNCSEANEICKPYLYNSSLLSDVGGCFVPCKSFTNDPVCAMNEWCLPLWQDALNGICFDIEEGGGLPEGEACGEDAGGALCAPDLICVGTCKLICKEGAQTGQIGSCSAGKNCLGLQANNVPLDIGMCNDNCDFHKGIACPDPKQSCAPSEFLAEQSVDVCFNKAPFYPMQYGQTCSAELNNKFCADGAFCYMGKCTKGCFITEGGFGPGHPDCAAVPGTICNDLGFNGFGMCML
jgi:hypothetical protein